MQPTNLSIVTAWLDCWCSGDLKLELLTEDFKHTSGKTVFTSKSEFITACWGKYPMESYIITKWAENGNDLVLWYEISNGDNVTQITEWYTIQDGQISEMRVFFS